MLQQSLALFQWLSGNKPEGRREGQFEEIQPSKFGVNDAAPDFLEPQQTGHEPLFPHPRIGTRTFIRSLEQIRGIRKVYCSDDI